MPAFPKPKFKRRVPLAGKRSEFPQKVREQIKRRDNYECQMCGTPYGLEIHHVVERSRGGRGVLTNGVTLCWKCHQNVQTHQKLIEEWQKKFEARYGPGYYRDEWDGEYSVQ